MTTLFPKQQRELSDEEVQLSHQIKDLAGDLHDLIDMIPSSREREAAITRLEESIMWAMRAISRAA
jgi:hypothetical protein